MAEPMSPVSARERRIVRVAGPRGIVLVLRGLISGGAEDDLRDALRAAIDEGAVVVVLDLNEVDALSSSARELIASAGSTLADRGGALLAWTTGDVPGEPSYLMRELRSAASAALFPIDRRTGSERLR